MSVGQDLTVRDRSVIWCRADGLQLLGEVQDSGLREATYLTRREDGQVIQLSELLYLVLARLDPARSPAEVASAVSAAFGRELTVEGLGYLLETRLGPLGLADVMPIGQPRGPSLTGEHAAHPAAAHPATAQAPAAPSAATPPGARRPASSASPSAGSSSSTSPAARPGPPTPPVTRPGPRRAPTARPLLSLSLRGTLLPARHVRRVAGLLAVLYAPFLVLGALVCLAVMDAGLVRSADFSGAVTQVLTTPALLVGLYLVLTTAALVHELGHAAACVRGGGRPGAIGVGVYLIFPAFFTDVTDSYRLDRRARLRTDLGGLYFNVLTLILLGIMHRWTGAGVFLLAMVIMHIEMLQQLVPVVRMDGYYVLADLAGVPDLFARVGPVLRSLRPGAGVDPRVAELRPRARRVVVVWVLLVVPTLLAAFAWLLWNLPLIVIQTIAALRSQVAGLTTAWRDGEPALVVLGTVSVLLLAVPLVGLAVLAWRAATGMVARAATGVARRATRRAPRNFMIESSAEESTMSVDRPGIADRHDDPLDGIWDDPADEPSDEPIDDSVDGDTREPAQPTGASATRREGPPMTAADFDPTGTAAEFCDAIMLPPRTAEPRHGWRRMVYRVSGQTINPGPSPAEQRRAELEARLRTPIEGSRRVVVMSRKGGVGKTTISFALGSTFSSLRGDRTIAVDANPDAGNLAHRVSVPNQRTVTDVLRDLDTIDRYATLRGYTSQAPDSRLEVLASDDDPRIGMALDRNDYHRLIGLLDHFYNLILLDTGTGILDSANQGLLAEADQLVLVLRAGLDGGRAAALTLDWLDEHDLGELVRDAVVVVNAVQKGVDTPVEAMVRHFERRCRRVVTVPWDPALELGAQTRLSSLAPATRESLVETAAAVADGFLEDGARA